MSSVAPQSGRPRRSAGLERAAKVRENSTLPQRRAATSARTTSPSSSGRWWKAALLACVAGGSALGVVKVRTLVEGSDAIAIHNIVVAGVADDSPRVAEVKAYAEVADGTPFFAVDPDVVAARVARHPFVGNASARRIPPDTLEIAITERAARAGLRVDGGVFLVDDEGEIMKRATADDAVDVPLLTLLSGTPAAEDSSAADADASAGDLDAAQPAPGALPARLSEALALLRAAESAGLAARVSEVVELPAVGFELILDDGARARVGNEQFDEKLRRLQATQARLRASGRQFSFMWLDDARHPERVAVRLRTATETTPSGG